VYLHPDVRVTEPSSDPPSLVASAFAARCPTCQGAAQRRSVTVASRQRTIGYTCTACGHTWDVTATDSPDTILYPPD